jgi:hypothetical protein
MCTPKFLTHTHIPHMQCDRPVSVALVSDHLVVGKVVITFNPFLIIIATNIYMAQTVSQPLLHHFTYIHSLTSLNTFRRYLGL